MTTSFKFTAYSSQFTTSYQLTTNSCKLSIDKLLKIEADRREAV